MRLEAGAGRDRGDLAFAVDHNAAFLALDGQGRANVAALLEAGIGGPKRVDDGFCEGAGLLVRLTIGARLRLFIGELGGRPHQAAHKPVRAFAAIRAEHHPNGHAGPIFTFAKAA